MSLMSIGLASKATGIAAETIRIWERRYGRPVPYRTSAGHRRYSDEQVDWLVRVRKAVARGVPPSQAVQLSDAQLDLIGDERPPAAGPPNRDVDALVGAVEGLDGSALVDHLDQAWNSRSGADYANDVVAPLMARLGRSAKDGDLGARHERYACGIIEDHLRARAAGAIVDASAPRVILLGCVEGPRCRVLMRMAALLCATERLDHAILPHDVDPAEIGTLIDPARRDVLAISVPRSGANRHLVERFARSLPCRISALQLGAEAEATDPWPDGVEPIMTYEAWTSWLRRVRDERFRAVG